MSGDLSHCPVVVVVFAMDGCHHCHEFLPRLERLTKAFQAKGWPFVIYDGQQVQPGAIPVIVLDGASDDPSIAELAERYNIEGMPTTLVMPRWGTPMRLDGAVDDREIYDGLVFACKSR